jgi:hypothetical protein
MSMSVCQANTVSYRHEDEEVGSFSRNVGGTHLLLVVLSLDGLEGAICQHSLGMFDACIQKSVRCWPSHLSACGHNT